MRSNRLKLFAQILAVQGKANCFRRKTVSAYVILQFLIEESCKKGNSLRKQNGQSLPVLFLWFRRKGYRTS